MDNNMNNNGVKESSIFNKQNVMTLVLTILGLLLFTVVEKIVLNAKMNAIRAQAEAELKAKGILPEKPKLRPKREIYLPIDRTGQANRVDSTEAFLKSAEMDFGRKQEDILSVVDYGSQVDSYEQRVNAIKAEESRRLAQQQAERAAYNQKIGRAPQPKASNLNPAANTNGTKINRLKTSSLSTKSSSFKK